MTAWLEKRGGRYRIRWNDPVAKMPNGKPAKHCQAIDPPCRTKAEAQPFLERFNAKLPPAPKRTRVNGPRPTENLTLLQLAMRWYDLHPTHSTRADYINAVRLLCRPIEEGGMAIIYPRELTKVGVEEWKAKRSNVGTDRRLAYVRSILNWAAEAEYIEPIDVRLSTVMAAPQSGRGKYRLLTDAEYAQQMAIAAAHGLEVLAHCLTTYGWRAITACKATVGMIDLGAGRVTGLHRKVIAKHSRKEAHTHRLLPETIRLLRPLVEGRKPSEPLFTKVAEDGQTEGWLSPRGKAQQLTHWYRDYCRQVADEAGGINAWKRYAIFRMKAGVGPWAPMKRALTNEEARQYTGHMTPAMLDLYMRPADMDQLFTGDPGDEGEGDDEADDLVVLEDSGADYVSTFSGQESSGSVIITVASGGGVGVASDENHTARAATKSRQDGPVVIPFRFTSDQLGRIGTR